MYQGRGEALCPYRCFIVGIFSGQGHSRGETRRGLAAGDGVRGAVTSLSNMSYLTLDCKLPGISVISDESSTLVVYNYSSYTFTQGPFYYAKCFLNYGNKAWRTDIFFHFYNNWSPLFTITEFNIRSYEDDR